MCVNMVSFWIFAGPRLGSAGRALGCGAARGCGRRGVAGGAELRAARSCGRRGVAGGAELRAARGCAAARTCLPYHT